MVSNPRRYSFYDPELRLIAETELTTAAQPAIEYEYIWFGDQPVAQIYSKTAEVLPDQALMGEYVRRSSNAG